MRRLFLLIVAAAAVSCAVDVLAFPPGSWWWLLPGSVIALGLYDYFQTKHAVLRNFPVVGHGRYLLELVRPEIYQYFIENDTDGVPFDREQRSLVYQRAKRERDTLPFGTKEDVYEVGYEWVHHSLAPIHLEPTDLRATIGGPDCTRPYAASLLNVAAMSYGALSSHAILALNHGAKRGHFAHNTGEGGISPYHLEHGGDLIWQIGTGYFGCRTPDGAFAPTPFREKAGLPSVKMIEIKLSQGAKPGHGGILPAAKVSPEIAHIRGVPLGRDVISPPGHATFSTPVGLLEFVARLRELADGKPVGLKLCVGKRREFLAICKAMQRTGILPDFISVDGAEGGTGAAPLEFSDHIGSPLIESLIFVHNALVGFGVRDRVTVIASGKITSGFRMVKLLALGADVCSSARGMMMALGCIQALRCNSNTCPTGVATQNPHLVAGLVPAVKSERVANFHRETIASVCEIMGAMGIATPEELQPWHVQRRVSATESQHYGALFEFVRPGDLLQEPIPDGFEQAWRAASAETFARAK